MTRPELYERYARWALDGLSREYPCKLAHHLSGPADVVAPAQLNPAFWGCYDWHSAVHSVWSLTRLVRLGLVGATRARQCQDAIDARLRDEPLRRESEYLEAPGRASFERPYGLAWLLTLALELQEWGSSGAPPQVLSWQRALGPLAELASSRLVSWAERLPCPTRSGVHDQSAFAFGLTLDYLAASAPDSDALSRLRAATLRLYSADRDGPLHLEPSAHDFLSPCLAEADLMRRVLPQREFEVFLDGWLPGLGRSDGPRPVRCPDASDGHLAHLGALNLSRAWMLEGVAGALPQADPRGEALRSCAREHRDTALAELDGAHYEGSHWQGSFAVYALTARAGRTTGV